jgi:hypothetical protein
VPTLSATEGPILSPILVAALVPNLFIELLVKRMPSLDIILDDIFVQTFFIRVENVFRSDRDLAALAGADFLIMSLSKYFSISTPILTAISIPIPAKNPGLLRESTIDKRVSVLEGGGGI